MGLFVHATQFPQRPGDPWLSDLIEESSLEGLGGFLLWVCQWQYPPQASSQVERQCGCSILCGRLALGVVNLGSPIEAVALHSPPVQYLVVLFCF